MTSGHTGCLFVTTLRLSLQLHTAEEGERTNKLLGEQVCTSLFWRLIVSLVNMVAGCDFEQY